MGIIRTDRWLEEDYSRPTKLCERLQPYFKGQSPDEIYSQLMKFGMYRPSWGSKRNLDEMINYKAWNQVEKLFFKYKNKWSGPDIPVFLFPLEQSGGFLFRRGGRNKAGVSYPDKMFLFLSRYDDPKEIEALLVHEYHHVCRMRALNKKMEEYTLLDSIIIEGLAEYAVYKNCGKSYLANWCSMYSERELDAYWSRILEKHLKKKRTDRIHDELLYGGGRVPPLLGYSMGYNIIGKFYETENYSTKLSFVTPAENYLRGKKNSS